MALRVWDGALQAGGGACARRAAEDRCAHLCVPLSAALSDCRCAIGYRREGTACTRESCTL